MTDDPKQYTEGWKYSKLIAGEPLHFPSNLARDARFIPLDWLEEAILKGVKIDLENTVIGRHLSNLLPLNLTYATIRQEISIRRSEVEGRHLRVQQSLQA